MRILSMTATFGKLNGQTLTLHPGLNVLERPNEWGKSTWCAFIVDMLYGIDTSSRSRKDFLAHKQHYAPWSGEPMSGRMDVEWKGRYLTLERSSKGRTALGDFRAYETQSGLKVPELTGENCGRILLGVEKSVFLRAGFFRLTDLAVTPDDALRRRLNSLVTTGDDSGAAEQLGQKLRELGNRIHRGSTGLLPEAIQQLEQLEQASRQCSSLRQEEKTICVRREQLQQERMGLENHRNVLHSRRTKALQQQMTQGRMRRQQLREKISGLRTELEGGPSEEDLLKRRQQVRMLRQQAADLAAVPEVSLFRGWNPEQAVSQAQQDSKAYEELMKPLPGHSLWWLIPGGILTAVGGILLAMSVLIGGVAALVIGVGLMLVSLIQWNTGKNLRQNRLLQAQMLRSRYGTLEPEQWVSGAQDYREYCAHTTQSQETVCRLQTLTGGYPLAEFEQRTEETLEKYKELADMDRELSQLDQTLQALQESDTPDLYEPVQPDVLTLSQEDTEQALDRNEKELAHLQEQLGRCRGRMAGLYPEEQLARKREETEKRIHRLQAMEEAVALAQEVQTQAARDLQRRFAPRITQEAQARMALLTEGRYTRMTWGEDLSLLSGTQEENTLRGCLWRSDGTADQLYLALRLAVAQALTPEAPLILDDALVRFDEQRLKAALRLLQQEKKQVILFTCQSRENQILRQL